MATDQWSRWLAAMTKGTRIETDRGNPPSGFYKSNTDKPAPQHIEAICVYRDEDGRLQCMRNVFGDGSKMHDDEIEELVAKCCFYPISEEIYRAVTERGEAWPAEYATRLTMKDQQAGVAWTPEYGRRRLGIHVKPAETLSIDLTANEVEKVDTAENPLAVIGHNEPPEPPEPLSADKQLAAEISATASGVKVWLGEIGGKPRNKAEADRVADYATTFKRLATSATDQHKVEKAPILQVGKEIDSKWFGSRDNAEAHRKSCLGLGKAWLDAENARLEAEARKANEEAAAAAEKAARQYDAPVTAPPPVEPTRVTGIGNMRTVAARSRDDWTVTDPAAFAAHLLALSQPPADLLEALTKIARRMGSAGTFRVATVPGVEMTKIRSPR